MAKKTTFKGNKVIVGEKFWLKRCSTGKVGRPSVFNTADELLAAAYEYFEYEHSQTWSKPEAIKGGEFAGQVVNVTVSTPFSIEGLCIYLGVNKKYLSDIEDKITNDSKRADLGEDILIRNKEFSEVVSHVRDVINKQKTDGALVGAFNGSLVSQIVGLTTKTETALTGADGGPVEHKVTINIKRNREAE